MTQSRAEILFHHITIGAFMLGILGYMAADSGLIPEEARLPFVALAAAGIVPNVCNRAGKIIEGK